LNDISKIKKLFLTDIMRQIIFNNLITT